jgi:hypothetical protein
MPQALQLLWLSQMDIGSLVYDENEQQLSGKNKLNIDCTNFNSGLYFITVTAGNSKVTKRLVVNK